MKTSSPDSVDVFALFQDPRRIRRQYRLAWILFGVNFAVLIFLYWMIPQDRDTLHFLLFASTGPLLCHGSALIDLPILRWIRARGLDRVVFVLLGLEVVWRAFTSGHRGLYLYLLLGMGPLMIMANVYTGLTVYEKTRKSLGLQNDKLS